MFHSLLVILLLVLTFAVSANAEICYEQRCVDGQCQTIPRPDLPGCDHPDDNFSVSNFLLPKSGYNYQYPDLVTFLNGYHESFSLLADRIMKGEAFTDLETFAGDLLGSSRVLVIPSGGLKGLKNSQIFKVLLDEFVKNGGVLVVFGQQQGDDFTVLPTPDGKPLKGYGWSEDQACLWNGVYLDTYHQVLASIATAYASVNVDGYFTSYPANSTTLLRRTSNDLPAMLMYDHGLGKVIVSSFYSDWGFARSQATNDEIAIIRDVISWAKQPANLPEFRPGNLASMPVSVENNTTIDAARVKLTVYNPDRTALLVEQTVNIPVAAGQSASMAISYQIPDTAMLGIYHVDYLLFDAQGNVVQTQSEADSGRFAVSNPAKQVNVKKDILFSVSTSSQDVFFQDTFDYTFHIFNNSSQPRNLTVKNFFRHTGRNHEWQIVANPNGETAITGSDQFIDSRWMFETMVSYLYDENGAEIGRYELSFKGLYPSVKTTVKTDKNIYALGETVNLSIIMENANNALLTGSLRVKVVDSANNTVFTTSQSVSVVANGANTQDLSYQLPQTLPRGSFIVIVEGYDLKGSRIGGNVTTFEIPLSQITASPSIPNSFAEGNNLVSFNLANVGTIPVSTGKLDLSVKDPAGTTVTELSQTFTLDVGQRSVVDLPVSLPPAKFGTYSLIFRASDETRVGNPVTVPLSSAANLDFTQDRLTFRIRETAGVSVLLTNTGKFNQENASLTLSVPDANYIDTRTVTVAVGQKQDFRYQIPVPETLNEGSHNVGITLTLPSGSTFTKTANLVVASAAFTIDYSGAAILNPGDIVTLTLENTGGVDAAYVTDKLTITDTSGKMIYEGSAAGSVLAGEKKTLTTFPVPPQTATGPVVLNVIVKNAKTGSLFSFSKNLAVNGLEAALSTWTDKVAYLQTEPIMAFSSIINSALAIDGGVLDLTVNKYGAAGGDGFRLFLPQKGWLPFTYSPRDVAVSPDGSIYVADSDWSNGGLVKKFDRNMNYIGVVGQYGSGNGQYWHPTGVAAGPDGSLYVASDVLCRILKYDRDGRFLVQKGAYCNSSSVKDGEFWATSGIATAADGSVYVADQYWNRIQKFDSNLNFITKWGTAGAGNGQFNYAHGVAVGPDGTVYVADTYNNRIQRFGANGEFIATLGGYGTGDGQTAGPMGVTVASDGAVFVADSYNHRIQKYDSTGKFLAKIGSKGSGDDQFYYPQGIAVSADGSVYVADTENKRLQQFDNNLKPITKWGTIGSDDGRFNFPYSISLGPDGSKYVVDKNNHRIQKFDRSGNFVAKWGTNGAGDGQFAYPVGVATGPDGSVYVADYGNNRIQKFDADGKFLTKWGARGIGNGQFYNLHKVAVSSDNFVYVLDDGDYNGAGRIQKFDSGGNFITKSINNSNLVWVRDISITSDGMVYVANENRPLVKYDKDCKYIGTIAASSSDYALAIAPDNSIYVVNGNNGTIEQYDNKGTRLALWGKWGNLDGEFYYPRGIAVDADGTVYVADTENHRIQKMTVSSGVETMFKTTMPVSQAAAAVQQYTAAIGILAKSGKMYLAADLKNNLGQSIGKAEYPFYVLQGTTLLSASTDKKVYRPGETVIITGEVQNLAELNAVGVSLILDQKLGSDSQNLFTATIDIPANGTYPISVTTTAGSAGIYMLTGKAIQNNTPLTEIVDQYEVAATKVSATISAPDVAGNEPFTINVTLKNEGKIPSTVTLTPSFAIPITDMVIPAGESRLIQFNRQIIADTADTFVFRGDLNQTVTKTVKYGPAVSMAITPQQIYPEGTIVVPVSNANIGLLDEQLSADYELVRGAENISKQTRGYFLPKTATVADTLSFDLSEGTYQLTGHSMLPTAGSSATFQVRKDVKVDLAMALGAQTAETQPVTVNLTNLGYYQVDGSVRLSLVGSDGAIVWNSSQDVSLPFAQIPAPTSVTFVINPSAVKPGAYKVRATLLDGGNRQLAAWEEPLTVNGSVFILTQVPDYQTLQPGQEASFVFKVKNSGNQEGAFNFVFKADDLASSTRTAWLKPGEETEVVFTFSLPSDLEEKDYFANYTLSKQGATTGEEGTIPYHLAGINLTVSATLDKQNYRTGENAVLTLAINQNSPVERQLVARANYNGTEIRQSFTLSGNQTLSINVPLTKITGEKLFYGIYHESGRSLHLDSLFIYAAQDNISVTSDRQSYNPGEQVTVLISGSGRGSLTISGPGDFSNTLDYSSATTRSFMLPANMAAGTYAISYSFIDSSTGEVVNGAHQFDVTGLQVKVKEAGIDRGKYAPNDTIKLSLKIESNTDLPATLKTWVVDPAGNPTFVGSTNAALTTAQPSLITLDASLVTGSTGIHRLLYGIYSGSLLLSSGSEAFDVGNAVLLGLSTDLKDYPTNIAPVVVKADLFGMNSANIEFSLDGKSVKSNTTVLAGVDSYTFALAPESLAPGSHKLNAVLTSDGLTSSREFSFSYGSSLPDLTVQLTNAGVTGSTVTFTATVANQGKTPVGATLLALYDGNPAQGAIPFATLNVPALAAGAAATLTYPWSVLGRAGDHVIYAVVDPANLVTEFVEANNTALTSVSLPNLTLGLATGGKSFTANTAVGIAVSLANLSSSALYQDLILRVELTDPQGSTILLNNAAVASLAPARETINVINWNTVSNPPGNYTISASLISGDATLVANSAEFVVEPTPSITGTVTLSKDEAIQGLPLDIAYSLVNNGNIALSGGEVTAAFIDRNSGITANIFTQTFAPLMVLQNLSQTLAIEKVEVQPGDYSVRLSALADGITFPIGEKALKVLPPIEVTKGLSLAPRVLVFLGKEEREKEREDGEDKYEHADDKEKRLALSETTFRQALDGMGAYYAIVRDAKEFKRELRSGLYNIYLLAGRKPLSDHLDVELAERIYSGDGLVLSNYEKFEDEKFRGLAGVKRDGHFASNPRLLTLLESPMTHPCSYQLTGKVQKLLVTSANVQVAAVMEDKGRSYPALVLNPFGEGKVAVFAFTPDATLLQSAVGYTVPTRIDVIPAAPLPVEVNFKSLGAQFDLKVSETVDAALPILLTYPLGTKDQQKITWLFSLGSNETRKLSYLVGLPEEAGTFDLSSEVSYLRNGNYEVYKTYPLTIKSEKGLVSMKTDILIGLQSLAVTGKDAGTLNKIIREYAKVINQPVITREQADEAIEELLELIEALRKLQVDTTVVRLDLDQLLKVYERKWSSLQNKVTYE